jgi:schlafen family protein
MSIYANPISQLKTSDLAELLQEQAVENTRLEFKREVPDKDETLKKLSSFANTFGGFVVIGAAARSKDGRIEDLRGIDEVPGFKQRIVGWCFKECSPPINADVSGPIPTPNNDGKVCYVILVEESDVAPHFLNGRKGIWIRTNEFSGRYEAALADEAELRQLLHRRQLVLERRARIVERARKRFDTYLSSTPGDVERPDSLGALFELCIVPRFPARQVCRQEELAKHLKNVTFYDYRGGVGFPRRQLGVMTQHESAIVRQPLTDLSFLEANVWGMVFYARSLDEMEYPQNLSGIHVYAFVGHLLAFLQHARDLFHMTGLAGSILVQASLKSVRERNWLYAKVIAQGLAPIGAIKPTSGLDDSFDLSLSTTTEYLREKLDEVAIDLLRSIFFSMNWADLVDSQKKLEVLVQQGHEFNGGRMT